MYLLHSRRAGENVSEVFQFKSTDCRAAFGFLAKRWPMLAEFGLRFQKIKAELFIQLLYGRRDAAVNKVFAEIAAW